LGEDQRLVEQDGKCIVQAQARPWQTVTKRRRAGARHAPCVSPNRRTRRFG
jgi:hypothetical protein